MPEKKVLATMIIGIYVILAVIGFLNIDKNSNSVSDTLLNFAPVLLALISIIFITKEALK